MPLKSLYRRKRFYRKKKFGKLKRISKKVTRLSRMVPMKQVGVRTTNNIGTAGTFILLNGLIKGDEFYNRTGSATTANRLELRMSFQPAETSCNMRVILAWYKDPLAASPAIGQLITTRDNAGNGTTPWNSPVTYTTKQQFQIIKDIQFGMGGFVVGGTGTARYNVKSFKWSIPLKGHRTIYNSGGNAGTIADINSGALYLFLISDNNVNLPVYDINSAFSYHDA